VNWDTVLVLLRHELRMLARDRRTILLSVGLPLLTMPLIFYSTKYITETRERLLDQTVYRYVVTGTEAARARALIEEGRRRVATEPTSGGRPRRRFMTEEVQAPDPAAALRARRIHFYVEALSGAEADAEPARKPPPKRGESEPDDRVDLVRRPERLQGVPLIRICYQGNRDASQAGQRRMTDLLLVTRRAEQAHLLEARGLPVPAARVVQIEESSLATPGQVTGSFLGRLLTPFLLTLLLSGGAVVAMDSIAGEKERGSLETLLTTAARRIEIVAAKQLAILAVALFITVVQVANLLVYLTFNVIELPADTVIDVPPVAILTLFVLLIPVAAAVASGLLMLSAYAKTYKEAQLYFFPVYFVSLAPALASMLPGVDLRSAIAFVPLANVSVAVHEIMVGKYDWPMLGVTFVVMAATAVWMMRSSARMLSQERLITASDADAADLAGGPALFPRHVLLWYGVMAAVLIGAATSFPQLASFRRQLLFNEIVIFLAAPLLMIRRYRLDARAALALRPVRPAVWLAVALLIPSGNLVGLAVFRLANYVVPVPREALEQFGRNILPADIPLWQLFVFVSVLPGICEEIGFRGTLLYGLRRRFRPPVLALVVGLIFGLFHVALFRIAPTAFIGVVLTTVALLTGSIFPGMVAHAGNNALGLWAAREGWALASLDARTYVCATVVFAAALYIIYRNRTPYPELK
jgi:sodium transport system permease protein